MPLSAGTKLGAYEIVGPLGAGGMGEVYRARDPRLGRDVAIKVASQRFSERFEREARAIAALNHPNICQLYDVGPDYLVMEFVDGGPIASAENTRKLLDLAIQIADGLAAAHAAGVIHRDLKPDNIFVAGPASSNPGRVKILDFGLAKVASSVDVENSPTRVSAITDPGTTVGTIHYMSPEQARGETNLSAQSDQFSFGLVLYEMAAGKRAFERPSAAEVMTAIIREDAEPLPATTPAPLRWVIERLLSKDPADRYDSTRDLYRELRQIRDRLSEAKTSAIVTTPVPARTKRRLVPMLVVAILALAAGVAATLALLPPPVDLAGFKFTPLSRMDATERDPAWSPDGKSIAFTASVHGINQVFTKAVDSSGVSDAVQITNTTLPCTTPFWSRDGSKIYYHSDNKLWAIPSAGGTANMVLANAFNASMHPDGKTVVFTRGGKLWLEALGNDQPRLFGESPFPNDRMGSPQFSPDGSKILAVGGGEPWILNYPSGAARKIPSGDLQLLSNYRWLPDSRHLIQFDADPRNLNTSMFRVDTQDGSRQRLYVSAEMMGSQALSPDGRQMAYIRGLVEWNAVEIAIPSGAVRTILGGSGMVSWWPDWARTGTHFLVATNRSGPFAIEDVSSTENFSRRLYGSESNEFALNARWSPDGSRFAMVTVIGSTNRPQLQIANSSGSRPTPIGAQNISDGTGFSWSPDGQWIGFKHTNPNGIAKIRTDSGAAPVVLVELPAVDRARWVNYEHVEWSPAGDWIAYPTAQGISLISPDTKASRLLTTRKLLIFVFSKDGARLFGIERDTTGKGAQWQLYQVDVATGVDKVLGPVDLPPSADALAGISMHPDGTRFLTSIAKWPFDIWIMEGFDQPKSWIGRLLRR